MNHFQPLCLVTHISSHLMTWSTRSMGKESLFCYILTLQNRNLMFRVVLSSSLTISTGRWGPHSWQPLQVSAMFWVQQNCNCWTLWNRIILWKLLVAQLLKKFHGTGRFITVFTRAYHWNLFWVRWIQFTHSHPISSRSFLILASSLDIPNGLSDLTCMLHVLSMSFSLIWSPQ